MKCDCQLGRIEREIENLHELVEENRENIFNDEDVRARLEKLEEKFEMVEKFMFTLKNKNND